MSLLRNRIVSHTRRNLWNFPPRFSYSPGNDLSPLSVATFTTSTRTSTSTSTSTSGTDHHAFFQQQLEELENERKSFLGDDTLKSSHDDLISTGNKLHSERTNNDNAEEYEVDMEELHAEREALFQFTSEEKEAWGNQSSRININSFQAQLSPQLMKDIEAARAAAATHQDLSSPTHHHESFSHVSKDGQSIHMVDVGHKQVTTRTARAQSKVILPPEVLDAFDVQSSELVGPKGPIFATAKIAGILAAK